MVLGGRGPEGIPYTVFVKKNGFEYEIRICDDKTGVIQSINMNGLAWRKGQSIATVNATNKSDNKGNCRTVFTIKTITVQQQRKTVKI